MDLLFFDLECANLNHRIAKICEFGYCVMDESFSLKERKTILINPGKGEKFFTPTREIRLGFPKSAYLSQPEFPAFYEQIKAILTRKDTLLFGYAVDNDVGWLHSEIKNRYGLEDIGYVCYDVQKMLSFYFPKGNLESLEKAYFEMSDPAFREEHPLVAHLSMYDSEMTAYVLRGILQKSGKTLEEALRESRSRVDSLAYGKHFDEIPALREEKMKRREKRLENLAKWKEMSAPLAGEKSLYLVGAVLDDESTFPSLLRAMEEKGYRDAGNAKEADAFLLRDQKILQEWLSSPSAPKGREAYCLEEFLGKGK